MLPTTRPKAAWPLLLLSVHWGPGKKVAVALLGEAVYLTKKEVIQNVHGVGLPPLSELIQKTVAGNVPVYV
jgi:predicted peroxiredoxin